MQLNSNVHTSNELLTSHSSSCALLNFVMKKYFATSFLMKKKEKQLCSKGGVWSGFFLVLGNCSLQGKGKEGKGKGKKNPYNR